MAKYLKFLLTPLAFFVFLIPSLAVEPSFSDVYEEDDFFVAVEYLARTGVLHGNPDGNFLPWDQINRAEVSKLVVTMQGIDPDPLVYNRCFPDVTNEWFAKYVCYAKEQGWIHGYPDGYFRPADLVNEAEMFKMVLEPLFGEEIEQSKSQSDYDSEAMQDAIDMMMPEAAELELALEEAMEAAMEAMESAEYAEEVEYENPMLDSYDEGIEEDLFFDDAYEPIDQQWFEPYVNFAKDHSIDQEYWFDASDFSTRNRVAQFIFNALISKANDTPLHSESWTYLRDNFVKEQGLSDILIDSNGCYPVSNGDFEFYFDYLEKTYDLDRFGTTESYYLYSSDSYLPVFDSGYFCSTEAGYLFSTAMALNSQQLTTHLIWFDKEGNLIEDQSEDCAPWGEYGIFAWDLPYYPELDVETVKLTHCLVMKDKNSVYVDELRSDEADPDSFELLRFPYGKDKNHAYSFEEVIPEADANTFETFDSEEADGEGFVIYARDAKNVFEDGYLLEDRDPDSFEILDSYDYTKDKNGVYYFSEPMAGADPETFMIIGNDYSKDANHVYYYDDQVPLADPESFQLFNPDWLYEDGMAFDKNYFYEMGQVADWFDEQNMSIINGFFIENNGWIEFNEGYTRTALKSDVETLEADDLKNFTVLEDAPIFPGAWATGGEKVYLGSDHLVNLSDPDTFEFIDQFYSKDANNVFYLDQDAYSITDLLAPIPNADPTTFEPLGGENGPYALGKDAQSIYYKAQMLDVSDLQVGTAKFLEEQGILKDGTGYTCSIDETSESIINCKGN